MIVTEKESYVQGSTALAPDVRTKNTRRKVKKKRNSNKNKVVKDKFKTIKSILLVFVIGVAIVSRYTKIYTLQREVNTISKNIDKLNKENENLRVDLVKYNNIQYVEQLAINKLKMIRPNKKNLVYCDLNRELIKPLSQRKSKEDEQKSKINKIKEFLGKLF